MNLIELETLGFYKPRILHLHLYTEEPIDNLNGLIGNDEHRRLFSIFLHEYVHFLQDISTPYGILRSFSLIELLKDIIHPVRNNEDLKFAVPVEINNAFNSTTNLQLQKLYAGDKVSANRIIYSYYELEYTPVTDKDGITYQVAQYNIHYLDTEDHTEKNLHLGLYALKSI